MKNVFIASLLLSFISCATQSTRSDLDTVDVSSGTNNGLEINEKSSSGYGPTIEIDEESKTSKKLESLSLQLLTSLRSITPWASFQN